jgi:transposase
MISLGRSPRDVLRAQQPMSALGPSGQARGIPRVDDRRVLNGIFWSCARCWRDLPETHGPRTTCYNRFVHWRQAGVWDQIMDALAAGDDAAVQMIDTSVVRVHQQTGSGNLPASKEA